MKKILIVIGLLLLLANFVFAAGDDLYSRLFITQNGSTISSTDGMFIIKDAPFEINIKQLEEKLAAQIFAYYSDEMFQKYSLPIATNQTEIFSPGSGLAMGSIDLTKGIEIAVTESGAHNYISSDRRINNNNEAIIKINAIEDSMNKFFATKTAYLTIFTDFNQNKIIENNEIANIIIKIDENNNESTSIINNIKSYVSSVGFKTLANESVIFNENFQVYKITNTKDAMRLNELLKKEISDYPFVERIADSSYQKNNKYVVFSPVTTNIKLAQPYHYNGDNRLIFDVSYDEKENFMKYVYVRYLTIAKESDIFKIVINIDGKYIEPMENRY